MVVFDTKPNAVHNCRVLLDSTLTNRSEWMAWYVAVVMPIVPFWFPLAGVLGRTMVHILGSLSWAKYPCKTKHVLYYTWWYLFGTLWRLVKPWLVFWGPSVGPKHPCKTKQACLILHIIVPFWSALAVGRAMVLILGSRSPYIAEHSRYTSLICCQSVPKRHD